MDPSLAKMMSGQRASRTIGLHLTSFSLFLPTLSTSVAEQGGDAAQKQQEQEEKMKCA
jgi:hypothetical protein